MDCRDNHVPTVSRGIRGSASRWAGPPWCHGAHGSARVPQMDSQPRGNAALTLPPRPPAGMAALSRVTAWPPARAERRSTRPTARMPTVGIGLGDSAERCRGGGPVSAASRRGAGDEADVAERGTRASGAHGRSPRGLALQGRWGGREPVRWERIEDQIPEASDARGPGEGDLLLVSLPTARTGRGPRPLPVRSSGDA
jgi:hypothetical protein